MIKIKNKVTVIFIIGLGLNLLVNGCSDTSPRPASEKSSLIFNDPHWEQGREQVYDVIIGDQNIGTTSYEIKPDKLEGRKVYVIASKTLLSTIMDVSKIIIRAEDLKPILTKKTVIAQQSKNEVKAEYSNSSVNVTINVGDNSQNMKLSLPSDTYDNEEILMIFQEIPLKEGSKYKFSNFSPFVGRTFLSEINVAGKENVVTAAETFECFKVEMKAAGETHYAWYTVSQPRYLIMYDNGQLRFKLNRTAKLNP